MNTKPFSRRIKFVFITMIHNQGNYSYLGCFQGSKKRINTTFSDLHNLLASKNLKLSILIPALSKGLSFKLHSVNFTHYAFNGSMSGMKINQHKLMNRFYKSGMCCIQSFRYIKCRTEYLALCHFSLIHAHTECRIFKRCFFKCLMQGKHGIET